VGRFYLDDDALGLIVAAMHEGVDHQLLERQLMVGVDGIGDSTLEAEGPVDLSDSFHDVVQLPSKIRSCSPPTRTTTCAELTSSCGRRENSRQPAIVKPTLPFLRTARSRSRRRSVIQSRSTGAGTAISIRWQ
jgi:hypothetical protein